MGRYPTERKCRLPFHPWANEDEYNLVAWLTLSKLSAADIDAFLHLKYVCAFRFFTMICYLITCIKTQNGPTLSFTSAKEMYERVEQAMQNGPLWSSETIVMEEAPDKPQILFYRDIHECVAHLLGNPTFQDSMRYEAVEVFESDGVTRVYNEMVTRMLWNEVQVGQILYVI